MRWYVSRNGETVGPVDENLVVYWIKNYYATNLMVKDEFGSNWMVLKNSPFRGLLPYHERSFVHRIGLAIGLACLSFFIILIPAAAVFGYAGIVMNFFFSCFIGLIALFTGNRLW